MAINFELKDGDTLPFTNREKVLNDVIVKGNKVHRVRQVLAIKYTITDTFVGKITTDQKLLIIKAWADSEAGQWIIKHCIDKPIWREMPDFYRNEFICIITVKLIDRDYTFWELKWGTQDLTEHHF